ncbi:hypothetical protein D9758_013304 [Tetrapyrgos nigripes]|uniref:MYND-type domain-containing protein n=1 Tax=Tetrapyrgos nigripes TaxID=182062 RepID=A0A8H5CDJ0_9AGAR|nr:hypothetical protein D9758_013304 [Tetrapyrgos nigripes]
MPVSARTAALVAGAYRHFRIPPPSFIDPSCPSSHLERSLRYLDVLSNHLRDATLTDSQKRAVLAEYTRNWPLIWVHVSTMLTHFILEGKPPTTEGIAFRDRLLQLFHDAITFFRFTEPATQRDKPPCLALMEETPELFPLILSVWHQLMDEDHSSLSLMFRSLDVTVTACLLDKALFIRNWECVDLAPNFMWRLRSYIYKQLRSQDQITLLCLEYAFRIPLFFSQDSPTQLLHLFITRETLTCLSWAFKFLTNPHNFLRRGRLAAGFSVQYLKYICLTFYYSSKYHGPSATAPLLRQGLLRSVLQAVEIIAYEEAGSGKDARASPTLAQWLANLFLPLGTYFCYHRVLDPVLQTLKEIARDPSLAQGLHSQPESCPLKKAFDKISTYASEIKELRDEFESEGLIICANPECTQRGIRTGCKFRYQQCSRCQATIYCPRRCQRRDWQVNNHRKKCEEVCQGIGLVKYTLTDVDLQFMEWFALRHIRLHWDSELMIQRSLQQARQENGTTDTSVLIVDYCRSDDTLDCAFISVTAEEYTTRTDNLMKVSCRELRDQGHPEDCPCTVDNMAHASKVKDMQRAGFEVVVHAMFRGGRNSRVEFVFPCPFKL